MKSATG